MEIESTLINITTENPERLFTFYRDVVGIPLEENSGPNSLNAGGAVIAFDGHSETHGRAKEPSRVLLDFFVADIDAEHERLVKAGVPCHRDRGLEYWGGIISTFEDPDGNLFQVMQYDPSKATAETPATAGQTA